MMQLHAVKVGQVWQTSEEGQCPYAVWEQRKMSSRECPPTLCSVSPGLDQHPTMVSAFWDIL